MRTGWLAAILLTCVVFASCGDDDPAPILVAAVYNVSGPQAVLDVPAANGSALAA
jgi:hypothetical protein